MTDSSTPFGSKKEEVYGFQTLYREIGYYISRLEQYERSLKFFDEAIKKTPKDIRCLKGRGWARSKICQYEGALEDIKKALDLKDDDLIILAHKCLNIYLNCEFETGLLQNHRLLPIRKKPEHFVEGAMHCTDAIENCLGKRAGRPLRDHFLIIRKLSWQKNFEAQKPYEPKSKYKRKKKKKKQPKKPNEPIIVSSKVKSSVPSTSICGTLVSAEDFKEVEASEAGSVTSVKESLRDTIYSTKSDVNIEPPKMHFKYKPLQRFTSNIENYMAEKYLDSLYKDKLFLKTMDKLPGVQCPNKKGSDKILQLAKASYKNVSYSQELLRTRRPFYYHKYQEATSSHGLKLRQDAELRKHQQLIKEEAMNMVAKLEAAVEDNNLKKVIDLGEKIKQYCDSKPKKLLPNRDEILMNIYENVCQVHFQMKRLNPRQFSFEQQKRIEVMLGLEISREPSEDSVIKQFRNIFVDWKKQILIFGERLQKAAIPEETAWCLHELARFHIELKQWEVARVYARKCIAEGRRMNNIKWIINAMMLIIKCSILQHNKNEAKIESNEAINIAKAMDGDEDLIEFLTKVYDVVDRIEFDSILGPKVLEKREQMIIQMMGGKMKDEAAHLFRTMQAMPASRRMSVMPGIRIEDIEGETKQNLFAKRMSIKPQTKVEPEPDIKEKMKNIAQDNTKGSIYDMIIDHLTDEDITKATVRFHVTRTSE